MLLTSRTLVVRQRTARRLDRFTSPLGSVAARLPRSRGFSPAALADGDATHHFGVYLAMVGQRPRPFEADRHGFPRVQLLRVELPVVRGHGVRLVAFVDEDYRVSRGDSRVSR